MPFFYFDVREGERFFEDTEGQEISSLNAAEHEAAKTAAAIARDHLPKRDIRDVTVEIRNQHGQQVCTVCVGMTIERVAPEPLPPAR